MQTKKGRAVHHKIKEMVCDTIMTTSYSIIQPCGGAGFKAITHRHARETHKISRINSLYLVI